MPRRNYSARRRPRPQHQAGSTTWIRQLLDELHWMRQQMNRRTTKERW